MSQPDNSNPDNDNRPAEFSTAAMLLKLVLLPGMVVLVMVMVILTIAWLTLPGGDVESLIDTLAREGDDRRPAAKMLADVLGKPGNAAIKRDPAIARRLINILKKEIEAGRMEPDQLGLRINLCRALGEFHLADPLPVLLEAARIQRSQEEVDVRLWAIKAVAVLVGNVGPAELRDDQQLLPALLELSKVRCVEIRKRAAFVLGMVGGDRAETRLEAMLVDQPPEVRYNAATGLARHGNPAAVEVLLQMLDPQLPAGTDFPQARILLSGLQATSELAAAGLRADLDRLVPAVERLTRSDLGQQIRDKASKVLLQLRRHGARGV